MRTAEASDRKPTNYGRILLKIGCGDMPASTTSTNKNASNRKEIPKEVTAAMTNGARKLHGKVMRNAQHALGMNHGSENKTRIGNEIQCTLKYGARSVLVGIHISMFFAHVAHGSTMAHGWDEHRWQQNLESYTWLPDDHEGRETHQNWWQGMIWPMLARHDQKA